MVRRQDADHLEEDPVELSIAAQKSSPYPVDPITTP